MGTINLKITAVDTSEVLDILNWIADDIEDKTIEEIKDYTKKNNNIR
jgi:hypothetical protein